MLAGQSNMLGRGLPLSAGEPGNPRLLVLRGRHWEVAADPLGDPAATDNGVGPGMTFGLHTVANLPGTTIGIVMCAKGNTWMADWQPSGPLYRTCVKEARAGGAHVAGILFLQGENDATDRRTATAWGAGFQNVLNAFRNDLGPDVPFVLGQIGLLDGTFRFQQLVRDQQTAAAAANPGVALVQSLDLPVSDDGVHFTIPSYKTLGARFAAAWWQLIGSTPLPPPPDFSVDVLPATAPVHRGESTAYTVSFAALNGFSGGASLSVAGLPKGAKATFSPEDLSGPGSSQLSVVTSSSTPVGTYTLTIEGRSGFMRRSTQVTLAVLPPGPDVGLSIAPAGANVSSGQAGTVSYRLKAASKHGLTGSVSFSVSTLPAGTTGSFGPPALALAPGQKGTATLELTTAASTPRGRYRLTITATGGGVTRTVDATLRVR